jgi:hypothetical protein
LSRCIPTTPLEDPFLEIGNVDLGAQCLHHANDGETI